MVRFREIDPASVKIREFRGNLSELISTVEERPLRLLNHGKPVAFVVSPETYEEFLRLRQVYTIVPIGLRSP